MKSMLAIMACGAILGFFASGILYAVVSVASGETNGGSALICEIIGIALGALIGYLAYCRVHDSDD